MTKTVLIILIFNISTCQVSKVNANDQSKDLANYFEYYSPESIAEDPINFYSIIHFVEYAFLSLIPFITYTYFWCISIIWEVLELFIYADWARESWLNKGCDLIFNWLGFYMSRKFFKKRRKV